MLNKINKKLVSIILVIVLVVLSCPAVFATEKIDASDAYVVTYSCEPVTDTDTLIEMALQQKALGIAPLSAEATAEANNDDSLLTVEQLVEVREYRDGSVEKDYALSSIYSANAIDEDSYSSQSSSYVKGYSVKATFYYTIRKLSTNPAVNDYQFKAKNFTTSITKTGTPSTTVDLINMMYSYRGNVSANQNFYYNNSSSATTQTFTMYTSDTSFHAVTGGVGSIVDDGILYTDINFGNGYCMSLNVRVVI